MLIDASHLQGAKYIYSSHLHKLIYTSYFSLSINQLIMVVRLILTSPTCMAVTWIACTHIWQADSQRYIH